MDGIFVCIGMVQFRSLTKALYIPFQATTYMLQLLYSDKTGRSKVATVRCEEETDLGPRAAGSPTTCIHPTKTTATTPTTPHWPNSEWERVCVLFLLNSFKPVLCLNAIIFQIVLYLPSNGCLVVHLEYLRQTVERWDAVWKLQLVTIQWMVRLVYTTMELKSWIQFRY